jgi:glycosyltransferase involved in cell wall biosynthesis
VTLLSGVPDTQLRWLYGSAAGLVAASREDFGLTPVEAASFGVPVAALRFGGYLDTVQEARSGLFFDDASPAGIRATVEELASAAWDRDAIRRHAGCFSEKRFIAEMRKIVGTENYDLCPA